MTEITPELLRKKAEHNEGMLSTLEEISLHQLNIKELTGLEQYCRHLKILYLQNNLIEEMRGLSKLKELEYLNLAVNSIVKIEGIKRCESLNKLDMTLNFVDLEDLQESLEEMEWCENLRDVYFTGNPCTDWANYREYTIAKVPQIMRLDGEEVTRSERLTAKTKLAQHEAELIQIAENNKAKKEYDAREGIKPSGYTREERWQSYVEEQEKKAEEEAKAKKESMFKDYNDLVAETTNTEPPSVYTKEGHVRQVNQGRYTFSLDESADTTKLIFNMEVPKFMTTDSLNVDLQPTYVRVDVKGKITQIRFDEDILVERSQVQRSTTTGWLCITMPRANCDQIAANKLRWKQMREEREQRAKLRALEIAEEEAREKRIAELQARASRDEENDAEITGLRGVAAAASTEEQKTEEQKTEETPQPYRPPSDPSFLIERRPNQQKSNAEKRPAFVPDFDEDEVPPLE